MAEPWDIEVDIRVAWGDMDAFKHVNNTVFLRWFETARIAWLDHVGFPDVDGGLGPILKTASVVYESPVTYPDTVRAKVRTKRVGTSSVTLEYEVTSEAQKGALVATGETVVVLVDYARGAKVALPDDLRARIERRRSAQ
jgi:acyl-CoA thioester hydrolase